MTFHLLDLEQGYTRHLPGKPQTPNPAHISEFLDDSTITDYNLTNALPLSAGSCHS